MVRRTRVKTIGNLDSNATLAAAAKNLCSAGGGHQGDDVVAGVEGMAGWAGTADAGGVGGHDEAELAAEA